MKFFIKTILLILALAGCKKGSQQSEDFPVARVIDKYLYISQLKDAIPSGLSEVDSLTWVKEYLDRWVRKELILNKAEENLTEEEKNVQKQIEDYRTSLLIFRYEQNLIQQKIDTTIGKDEIVSYFTENSSNFILNAPIVKALFIKLPRNAPDIGKVRRWYRSEDPENIKKLDAYCFQHAEKYDYFDEGWVQFDLIKKQIPSMYSSNEYVLKNRKNIEVKDSSYVYFVHIYDYRLAGSTSPLETVEGKIRNIILNKRKIQFINRLESEIYNDALNRENFNIY